MIPLNSANINKPLKEIEKRIDSYPAMPAMCQHLIKSCEDPDVNFKKLVDEIRYDPGITANILKMANSAYYGSSRRIESLQTAMVRLGLKQISEIVIAHSVADRLVKKLQGYDLRPEELLKHSVWVAIAAEDLANVLHIKPPAMLFTAGLLHDLGKIILDDYILDQREVLLKATGNNGEDKISFDIVEHQILGINHAEVGAQLLENWNFPEELVIAVRYHHAPTDPDIEYDPSAAMVHIADMLAYSVGIGIGVDGLQYVSNPEVIERLHLKPIILEGVASRTLEKMEELKSLLVG